MSRIERFLSPQDLALLLRVRSIRIERSSDPVVYSVCWEAEELVERWQRLRTDRKVSIEFVRAHLEAAIRIADAETGSTCPAEVH